jgi:hypothetical protein
VDGVRVFGIIVRGGGLGDVDVKELMIPVVIRGRSSLGKVQFRGGGGEDNFVDIVVSSSLVWSIANTARSWRGHW